MGFWELVLIMVLLFLFVGPKKLPEVARELGKGVRWLRKNYNDFKVAITREVNEANTDVQEWKKTKS